ncbi:MAG: hypothetical protein JSV91_11395 [Phycisphaerales bacterium]|nr:MAG: hypothetical protein JSV91_11395 [Phycisphaerales bacterium]
MPLRPSIVLLTVSVLIGCGESSSSSTTEGTSTPNGEAVLAEPAPFEQEVAADASAVEELAEASADESVTPPPNQEGEVDEGTDEPAGTEKTEEPPPPAPPVKEPADIEIDETDDESAPERPASDPDQTEQVETADDPVVSLLDELEGSAADLTTFTADVLYQTEDALLGQKVSRRGAIAYAVEAETNRKKFAIRFNQIIESGRLRERQKHYIFSDRWLVEIDHAEKTFIKREIVPPGKEFDPLKLGEGPFPLPIGQARADVLARFDVGLIELPEEGSLARLRDTLQVHGLRLKPKAGTAEAEDYDHIDLFYDKNTLLPAGVEVIETNGDRKIARLENLKRNPELEDDFNVAEPDPTVWRIDVRPWQDRP